MVMGCAGIGNNIYPQTCEQFCLFIMSFENSPSANVSEKMMVCWPQNDDGRPARRRHPGEPRAVPLSE
jgi:hypothetical protein